MAVSSHNPQGWKENQSVIPLIPFLLLLILLRMQSMICCLIHRQGRREHGPRGGHILLLIRCPIHGNVGDPSQIPRWMRSTFVNPNDENEEEAKGRPLVFTDHQINVDSTKDHTSVDDLPA
ncbi:hypothetical protein U1Q18_021700 [Sarracenia purpurea var. burkii]